MSISEEFKSALVAAVRESVIQKKAVKIGGLGTFKAVHMKQHQKQYKNGRVVLQPPRDYLTFTPEMD